MTWVHSGGQSLPTNFDLDLIEGKLGGKRGDTVFGVNPQVPTVGIADLWDPGGVLVYPVQPGETWEVVSTDVNDTAAGTGARTLFVAFLDNDYTQQNQVLTLNGTTPVTLAATDAFRFRNAIVLTAGSGNENAGNITFRPLGGGNTRGQINAGDVNSFNGHFTIPFDEIGHLIFIFSNVNKNEGIEITLKATIGEGGIFSRRFLLSLYQDSFGTRLPVPPLFGPKSDLKLEATSTGGAALGAAALQFIMVKT